jgi:hypothetical protein
MKLSSILAASVFAAGMAVLAAPRAEAATCAAFRGSADCQIIITYNPDGSITTTQTPGIGPFDGIEDTYVGVVNNSGHTIFSTALHSATLPIAGFDGDSGFGGDFDYSGPDTSFTVIDSNTLIVNYNRGANAAGLADGHVARFTLEEDIELSRGGILTPEPATLAVFGIGLLGAALIRRRQG